jgi:RNA recognition motif-containing protein
MTKRIYVGNLPFSATEDEVRERFAEFGEVESVNLISDRYTGQPRGFGFVEMGDEDADSAIAALNNTSLGGRTIKVSAARQREGGARRGGGGGGGRGDRW